MNKHLTRVLITIVLFFCGLSNVCSKNFSECQTTAIEMVLNSNGFNAKKRSSFTIFNSKEVVQRGLTVIHFNAQTVFEHRTFDTYGSEEEQYALLKTLQSLLNNNEPFAILAHDSAVKGNFKISEALVGLGLIKLGTLKSRQAYTMHTIDGTIKETVNDMSIAQIVEIPSTVKSDTIFFPKETYEFEPRVDRFIAHAGGAIEGHAYTNTKTALDANYKKGFRLFELDIIETADGHLVAAHDWKMWSRFTDYTGTLPPTLEQFKNETIYGDYITMDMNAINDWFATHSDAILVTDKLNDPIGFADKFVDKNRLIMELFSLFSIEEASRKGIKSMLSQQPLLKLKGDKLNFLKVNNVEFVAVSRRIIEREKKLMKKLRDNGIKVYVYNVNFDDGKDEKYVYENEIGLVYGMYADTWEFEDE